MPNIKHSWKHTEIDCLVHAINKYGRDWAGIQSRYFPKLTVKSIRNMFYKIMKDDPALLEAVIRCPVRKSSLIKEAPLEHGFNKYPVDDSTNINMDDFTVHFEFSLMG